MSGNAVMKPCADAAMAARPTEGAASLILSEPCSAKNAATLAASWLHHAAVYLAANSFKPCASIGLSFECWHTRGVATPDVMRGEGLCSAPAGIRRLRRSAA